MGLEKTLGSPVEGKKFFDREHEIALLSERVREGNHTLLVGQRRMGKTSVVRELLRRLQATGEFATVFVDFEDAQSPAETVVELATASMPIRGVWDRAKGAFANVATAAGRRIDEVGLYRLRVKLRDDIDSGNWRTKGDAVLAAVAEHDKPVVLAIDEFPIFVNRILKGNDHRTTPEGIRRADEYLSWLRKNVHRHQGRVRLVVSGSIGLMPIVRQAGLAAPSQRLLAVRTEAVGRADRDGMLAPAGSPLRLGPVARRAARDVPKASLLRPAPRPGLL